MIDETLNIARRRLAAALGAGAPFPWQLALLDRFMAGDLPSALDIPTGLGKTAVMAVWLVARAAGAPVPRRLAYVVDRRAVVDQATSVAENLRKLVELDLDLKKALTLEGPLPISTLRGQFVDNREWLDDPSAPAIVLGTVDMVGSRLLFSGYGVSRKMRPYQAGLLGADTLVVLDEAHLVPPFEHLVESIAADQTLSSAQPMARAAIPKMRVMSLSATGRTRKDAFGLSSEDLHDSVVQQRLAAKKALVLRDEVERKDLPERLAAEARSLVASQPLRCIVFCDRREDAKKTHALLEEHGEAQLFVGGRRIYERVEAATWLSDRGFLAGSKRPKGPTFVVATSAGEVGVDLDADHMVCDVVAWERMVQRLGRVNRRGEGSARVVVVPVSSDTKTREALEKYEAAQQQQASDADAEGDDESSDQDGKKQKLKPEERALAERQLRVFATLSVFGHLPNHDGAYDASPGTLADMKRRATSDTRLAALLALATTPEPLRPALTRPLVEAWSMTSLEVHSGRPEVAPWLRGWVDDEEPQSTIIWRKHLPVDEDGALFAEAEREAYFDAAPPHLLERLETESWRAAEWLGKRLDAAVSKRPASPGPPPNEEREGKPAALTRDEIALVVCRDDRVEPWEFRELETKEQRTALERTLAGATLIVDVRLGGLSQGLLDEGSDLATDVGTLEISGKVPLPFRMRIEPAVSPQERWREEARIIIDKTDDEATAWLVIESDPRSAAQSEEGRSMAPGRAQQLEEHEEWAEKAATRIGNRLALSAAHVGVLALAARLHDEGKRASNWQRAFGAGTDGPYAKTTGRPNFALLNGYRHELGSLPYAERDPRVLALEPGMRDLCLHLIAAHHGYARPLIRTDGGEEPPSRLERRAQEIALRFARLEKHWGPWGLAWWEALLRAADQQASRRNDEEGRRG
jgi:CRISPR-associated endonuclease/helicase Cas3